MVPTPRIVVDATVVIQWLVSHGDTDRAIALAHQAANGDVELSAPDLCLFECGQVLWTLTDRLARLGTAQGIEASQRLGEIPLKTTPSRDLLPRAFQMALELDVSVSEAVYLALGEALDATVVTADATTVRRLRGSPHADRAIVL